MQFQRHVSRNTLPRPHACFAAAAAAAAPAVATHTPLHPHHQRVASRRGASAHFIVHATAAAAAAITVAGNAAVTCRRWMAGDAKCHLPRQLRRHAPRKVKIQKCDAVAELAVAAAALPH
eukprot:356895-Chlamydomonas_euryale.AAC.2